MHYCSDVSGNRLETDIQFLLNGHPLLEYMYVCMSVCLCFACFIDCVIKLSVFMYVFMCTLVSLAVLTIDQSNRGAGSCGLPVMPNLSSFIHLVTLYVRMGFILVCFDVNSVFPLFSN